MVLVHQIQIRTSGFPGAPGFTTLAFDASVATFDIPQYTAVKTWLETIKPLFPNLWSAQIQPGGRVVDEATGILSSFTDVDATQGAPVAGVTTDGYGAGVAGAVVGLSTNVVNRGRKVRGRIFAVPLGLMVYDQNGTLKTATITTLTDATTALRDAGVGFGVWSRPRLGLGGKFALVSGVRVNDQAAFLSSRRT